MNIYMREQLRMPPGQFDLSNELLKQCKKVTSGGTIQDKKFGIARQIEQFLSVTYPEIRHSPEDKILPILSNLVDPYCYTPKGSISLINTALIHCTLSYIKRLMKALPNTTEDDFAIISLW